MSGGTLYALTGDLLSLSAALDACEVDEDGVVAAPPDLLAALDAIGGDYTAKIEACSLYWHSLTAEAEMVAGEAARLAARGKRLVARAERLREALRRSLVATHTHHVHTALADVALRKGSTHVEVTDGDALDMRYRRIVPEEWKPNLTAIGDALKKGELVQGAKLATGEVTLTIR